MPGLSCSMWGLLVVACWICFSCGIQTLKKMQCVGSSSLTRDWTWAPCIGSTESSPLDHQGGPQLDVLLRCLTFLAAGQMLHFLTSCWQKASAPPPPGPFHRAVWVSWHGSGFPRVRQKREKEEGMFFFLLWPTLRSHISSLLFFGFCFHFVGIH